MKKLPEQITINNAKSILQKLCQFIDKDQVQIDLSRVTHCDSAGLSVLIEAKIYAKQQNKTIQYRNQHTQSSDLATFLKVDAILFSDNKTA